LLEIHAIFTKPTRDTFDTNTDTLARPISIRLSDPTYLSISIALHINKHLTQNASTNHS
jgi:hypothetical protein